MDELLKRDDQHLWHPFTSLPVKGPKTILTRAEGAFVLDLHGNRYYDATASWWCNIHGHCHPRLVEALARQASQLDQVLFAPHSHPVAIELATRLLSKLGKPFSKIFYSDNGSTAVETALKMALQYWHNRGIPKRRFVSLERAYHGDTLGAVSVSAVSEFHHFFKTGLNSHVSATVPYCYRCPMGLSFPDCALSCLNEVKSVIESQAAEIAALVIEPLVLGAGGMIVYPKDYLQELVTFCRQHDILVIFDEVFTGFGRTGTFFAMDQVSEKPDIICLSKGLTSGMLPLAVTAVSSRVFEAFLGKEEHTFYHGHTYTGNALGCAVAVESLKIFDDEQVLERNQKLIGWMSKESERFASLPHVGDTRHLGMIWALELVTDKNNKTVPQPHNGPGWKIASVLWEQGIWIRPLGNILYLIPPYCSTESDLRHFFSVLYTELENERHFKPDCQ